MPLPPTILANWEQIPLANFQQRCFQLSRSPHCDLCELQGPKRSSCLGFVALIPSLGLQTDISNADAFVASPDEFPVLFRRLLSLTVDTTYPTSSKLHLLSF